MIKEILRAADNSFPFEIKKVDWDPPSLNIIGEDWAFFTMESWRIVNKKEMVIGSSDSSSEIHEILEEMVNEKIVGLDFQSKHLIADPVFLLSNEWILEIFSSSKFEPWTLKIPKNSMVFVASPGDSACVDTDLRE